MGMTSPVLPPVIVCPLLPREPIERHRRQGSAPAAPAPVSAPFPPPPWGAVETPEDDPRRGTPAVGSGPGAAAPPRRTSPTPPVLSPLQMGGLLRLLLLLLVVVVPAVRMLLPLGRPSPPAAAPGGGTGPLGSRGAGAGSGAPPSSGIAPRSEGSRHGQGVLDVGVGLGGRGSGCARREARRGCVSSFRRGKVGVGARGRKRRGRKKRKKEKKGGGGEGGRGSFETISAHIVSHQRRLRDDLTSLSFPEPRVSVCVCMCACSCRECPRSSIRPLICPHSP